MAKRVKDTKKSQQESAAKAAEDLKVIFPDSNIFIAGEQVVVQEYPFIKWLELKVNCGEVIETLAELLTEHEIIQPDHLLEFFENQFQEIEFLIRQSISREFEFLEKLSDDDMQKLIFTWWRVNQHFFLRSAFRLIRTTIPQQFDGQQSSTA